MEISPTAPVWNTYTENNYKNLSSHIQDFNIFLNKFWKKTIVYAPYHKELCYFVYLGSPFTMLYNIMTVALGTTLAGFATIYYNFMTASGHSIAPNETGSCFH